MDKKLYNIIFPTCLIVTILPSVFLLLVLVGNFAVDSLVVLIISKMIFGRIDKSFYKTIILKVWSLGYVADCLAAIFVIIVQGYHYKHYNYLVSTTLGVIMAFVFIFVFNYFITFKKIEINKKQKVLSAIIIAILTAPYTFFIPEYLFYQ